MLAKIRKTITRRKKMIKINIIKVKFFKTKQDLFDYCKSEFCWLVGSDFNTLLDKAEVLTNKIWNTDVGQIIKTDLGHNICIAGKVIPVNHLNK
jgi:hypothetical protein